MRYLVLFLGLLVAGCGGIRTGADNVQLNPGSGGDVLAADEGAGGEKYQRVKPVWGPDGTQTDVSDTAGGRFPVEAQGYVDEGSSVTARAPVAIGCEARTVDKTAVDNGDAVRLICDDIGRVITYPSCPRDAKTQNHITLTTTAETTLIAAGGAGVFRDLNWLYAVNESTEEVRVDFRDSTAGTIRFTCNLAPNGGSCPPFEVSLNQATANNNWTAKASDAVSSIYVMAQSCDQN